MKQEIMREITPLTQSDCFTLFSRVKEKFDFPLHYHEEYELNLILNAGEAKRIVGDHVEEIGDAELVLVGPNLYHAWFTHKCQGKQIRELTIQFHRDLFEDRLLGRNQLSFIKGMFEMAQRGILFAPDTIARLLPRLLGLEHKHGFDSVLELFSILHDLSTSRNMRMLSTISPDNEQPNHHSRRLEKVFAYMNTHYSRPITLAEVAKIANMPETSFSRFIKKRLGNTFTDSLHEIRLGHATRLLIDTTHNVTEVAYKCGFNNISNFNRTFKKRKGCTPKEFRSNYTGSRIFI
ncbi:MAG: helix-turn-helix domain-containing protein [Janthinobacterium lividum]